MNIINREEEIEKLNEWCDVDKPVLGCLYGRRRVGKSYLLNNLWSDERTFYYLAGNATADRNRRELINQLNEFSAAPLHPEDFPSWRDVFRLIKKLAGQSPLVVVLDEAQRLMEQWNPEQFTSELNAIWDVEVENENLTLFLCGSEISIMAHLNDADAPLHGRWDFFHRLKPFDYYDASKMMGDRSNREYIRTYTVYGGMPGYLDSIVHESSLKDHACRNILSSDGPVGNQLDSIFQMEEGIREPRKYRSVLTAVAEGNTRINEIAQASGVLGKDNQPARNILEKLMELYLIRRERNLDTEKGHYRYYVKDPAVKFWYRFVHDNRERLDRGEVRGVWESKIEPVLNDYVGPVFEQVCCDAFFRFALGWGFSRQSQWSRWVGTNLTGKSVEIDIVAKLDDGRMLTGEVKWSSSPVGDELHTDHVEKVKSLRNSGRKWVYRALSNNSNESAGHIYFSSAGFTDEFKKRSSNTDRITLIDLDDMF